MKVKTHVPFLPDATLEKRANALLHRYCQEIEPVTAPPVPVEQIADFLLELSIDWAPIPDTDDDPILAYIHADENAVRINESRWDFFQVHMGSYEFTLAHEVGHHQLHLMDAEQLQFGFGQGRVFICRGTAKNKLELQANRFAAYLLMPKDLVLPAIATVDLLQWPNLYELCSLFKVSITALRIRLEHLGLIFVDTDGQLFPSEKEAAGQLRMF